MSTSSSEGGTVDLEPSFHLLRSELLFLGWFLKKSTKQVVGSSPSREARQSFMMLWVVEMDLWVHRIQNNSSLQDTVLESRELHMETIWRSAGGIEHLAGCEEATLGWGNNHLRGLEDLELAQGWEQCLFLPVRLKNPLDSWGSG